MGRCDGFCRGIPDEAEYTNRIEQAMQLLSGHYKTLSRAMREEMQREAEQLHFEQAAALRDRVNAIESLGKRQKVIAGICADTDIWGVYRGAAKCGWAVIHVEDGSVTGLKGVSVSLIRRDGTGMETRMDACPMTTAELRMNSWTSMPRR